MTATIASLPLIADLCPEAIGAPGIIQYSGPIRSDWSYVPAGDRGYAIYGSGRAGNLITYIPAVSADGLAAEMRRRIMAYRDAIAEDARAEAARYAALPLDHVERQVKMTLAMIERGQADLTTFAIEWLGIDLAAVWAYLDDADRDWLVESGVVDTVEASVTCTDAESWQSDWRTESGAAWPTYDLEIRADGMPTIEVQGWHLVGQMGPDGNRQYEEWATEDDDGSGMGLPRVSDGGDGWEIDSGNNVDGGGPIPCWRQGGRWVTLDREALDDSIRDAASDADHGDEPSWDDVTVDDMEIKEHRYIIRDSAVEEISILTGGIAGHDVYMTYRDVDDMEYYATAWAVEGSDAVYRDEAGALAALREIADNGKAYTTEAKALAALGRIVMDAHDAPAGLEMGIDDDGLYVVADDAEDNAEARFHLDSRQLTAVARNGWMVVVDDVIDALGIRATLDAAREWQSEMDRIVAEKNPWVMIEDSIGAGNCPAGSKSFAADLARRIGASGPESIGAARASLILATRNDAFTRRAVRVAAQRTLEGR